MVGGNVVAVVELVVVVLEVVVVDELVVVLDVVEADCSSQAVATTRRATASSMRRGTIGKVAVEKTDDGVDSDRAGA